LTLTTNTLKINKKIGKPYLKKINKKIGKDVYLTGNPQITF